MIKATRTHRPKFENQPHLLLLTVFLVGLACLQYNNLHVLQCRIGLVEVDRYRKLIPRQQGYLVAGKIASRNFRILREDCTTSNIFNKPPVKAFRSAKNLKDLLVRSSLPRNLPHQSRGTFPCNRTVCRTCPHVNSSSIIKRLKGHVKITGHFSCITENVVYCVSCTKCPSTVYIGETGRRLADLFREHRRDIINGKNELPVPAHFNQTKHTLEDMKIAVLKAGLANQEYCKKQEMGLIFRYGTVSPSGLNQELSFT